MGNHDTGNAQRIVEQADQAHQHAHGDRVLTDERLVIHEDLRIQCNRPCQCHAALHATGEFIRHQLDGAAQAYGLQLHQDNVTNHFFGQLGVHTQRKGHVLENVEVGEQRAALKQHAHLLAHVEQLAARQVGQVEAVDPDLAGARAQLGGDQPQQRGLAAAGRPHDPGNLATRDANVDVLEDISLAALKTYVLKLDRVLIFRAHRNSIAYCLPNQTPGIGTRALRYPSKRLRTIAFAYLPAKARLRPRSGL
ncbi:hypothetical protein SRABI70_01887 [Pseudomonas sp. Bi70]|nr:hypothetical protein SRABI70_01887 [Pseudomonas sp. Bi70]